MFNQDQSQHILEVVEHCAVGLITKGEMVSKLEAICRKADPASKFEDDAVLADTAAEAEALAIFSSTSVMAERP